MDDDKPTVRRRPDSGVHVAITVGAATDHTLWADLSFDVTAGGVFVATYHPLALGTVVHLLLTLEGEEVPVAASGVVRWTRLHREGSEAPAGVGVRFVDLPEEVAGRLTRFASRVREPMVFELDEAAVGVEALGVAPRAALAPAPGHVFDGVVGEPERAELRADGPPQVHERLLSRAARDDVLRRDARDPLGHVGADLEAARADARADGRDEAARRACARAALEPLHGLAHDARLDASPARVRRDHTAARGIRHQHRHAVGDPHARGRAGARMGADGVRLHLEQPGRSSLGHREDAAVDLARLVQLVAVEPDRLREAALVLAQLRRVAQDREVERLVGRLADAAEARREPVREPRCGELLRGQDRERHGRIVTTRRAPWPRRRARATPAPAGGFRGITVAPMARQQDPFIGRDILNGQFQILQKIGSGGMGSVYKALQPAMNRMVAVKILHPKLANRKDLVSRFRREARAMSHLTHPNTVKVYLYGELEDGSLYIVMEYLEGKNLNQTVRGEGPMPVERGLPILIQACNALEEAHRAGIVHRDLKPENIFITQVGGMKDYAKVLDFGLAKVTEREMRPGSIILTQEGMVFGTPEFMSPEQAQGKTLTASSDIYSLAVILYEVLTGKLPFEAKNPMEYIQLHVTAKPKPINERVPGKTFPPLLWMVLERALAKKPEERFASAAEFAAALQAVLNGATELPGGEGQPARPPMPSNALPTPLAQPAVMAAATVPAPARSSPLPQQRAAATGRPPVALLVGVAVAFLIVGAILAAIVMKLVVR